MSTKYYTDEQIRKAMSEGYLTGNFSRFQNLYHEAMSVYVTTGSDAALVEFGEHVGNVMQEALDRLSRIKIEEAVWAARTLKYDQDLRA